MNYTNNVNPFKQPQYSAETLAKFNAFPEPLKLFPNLVAEINTDDLRFNKVIDKEIDKLSLIKEHCQRELLKQWERGVEQAIIKALEEKGLDARIDDWGDKDWKPFIEKHIFREPAGEHEAHLFYRKSPTSAGEYLFTYSTQIRSYQEGNEFKMVIG